MSREWAGGRARGLSPAEADRRRDEAVRALASRVAHQLGNLVQVVSGNLELIAQRTTDETALRYLENARAAADQLTALARTLPIDPPD
jgi:two-component sensor histidine kinase